MEIKRISGILERRGAILDLKIETTDLSPFLLLETDSTDTPRNRSLLASLIFNPRIAVYAFSKVYLKEMGRTDSVKINNFIGHFVRFREKYGSTLSLAVRILKNFDITDEESSVWIDKDITFIETLYRKIFFGPDNKEKLSSMIKMIDDLKRTYLQKILRTWYAENVPFFKMNTDKSDVSEKDPFSVMVIIVGKLVTSGATDDDERLGTIYKGVTDNVIKDTKSEVIKHIIETFDKGEDRKIYDCVYQYMKKIMIRDIVHPLRLLHNENIKREILGKAIGFFADNE
jgi:hypothetical protein